MWINFAQLVRVREIKPLKYINALTNEEYPDGCIVVFTKEHRDRDASYFSSKYYRVATENELLQYRSLISMINKHSEEINNLIGLFEFDVDYNNGEYNG